METGFAVMTPTEREVLARATLPPPAPRWSPHPSASYRIPPKTRVRAGPKDRTEAARRIPRGDPPHGVGADSAMSWDHPPPPPPFPGEATRHAADPVFRQTRPTPHRCGCEAPAHARRSRSPAGPVT